MVMGFAEEIKAPGPKFDMELMLNLFAPFHETLARDGADRHTYRAYVTRHELYTKAYVEHLPNGKTIRWGWRQGPEGSWTSYVIIPRWNGLTLAHARKLAEAFGVEQGEDAYRYSHPGGPFTHPGGLARKSRTRFIFTQHGGLDI